MEVKRGQRGRKKVPKFALAGILAGVWATKRWVKRRTGGHWGCGRDEEKGRGGPSVSPLLFAGAGGEGWQDDASPNAFPGSGKPVFYGEPGYGECCGPSRKINCHQTPGPHGYKINRVLECSQFLA